MKILILSLFTVFGVVSFGLVDDAYSHPGNNTRIIYPAPGSSTAGCQDAPDGCNVPITTYAHIGDTISFTNTDVAAHIFKAGTIREPTGEFDSGLVGPGASYEWTPEQHGYYEYFCTVHPWRSGTILVFGQNETQHENMPKTFGVPKITLEPDQDNYFKSDIITITGYTYHNNDDITITIEDPQKQTIAVYQITPNVNGQFEIDFTIDSTFKTHGLHSVIAKNQYGWNTVSFNITPSISELSDLETKKERKTDLKNQWKERFQVCKDERKDLKTNNKSLKSKFNTIESLYNTTETEKSELERLYTELDLEHERVKQELIESQDTVSSLYSQYYDLQSTHNSTLTELHELRERVQELES